MPSTLPKRSERYAIAPGTEASRALFDAVFGDIHDRLLPLEGTRESFEDVIDRLSTQALASVSATLTQEISTQRATLAEIQTSAETLIRDYGVIQTQGVPATQIRVAAIGSFDPKTVQAAIEAIQSSKTTAQAVAVAHFTKIETNDLLEGVRSEAATRVSGVLGGVVAAYDTLKKIVDWATGTFATKALFELPAAARVGYFLRVAANGAYYEVASPAAVRTAIAAQVRVEQTPILELGAELTGDRAAVIDMHAAGTPNQYDYRTRIVRYAGLNGDMTIINAGSGTLGIASGGPVSLSGAGTSGLTWNGAVVWHSGNDGVGSGLDADLLDGQSSEFYTNIAARLGFTPARQLGTNTIGLFWDANVANPVIRVDATDVYLAKTSALNALSGEAVRGIRLAEYTSHGATTDVGVARVVVGVNAGNVSSRVLQFFTPDVGWQNVTQL